MSKIELNQSQSSVYGFITNNKCISSLEINNRSNISLSVIDEAVRFLKQNKLIREVGSSPKRYSPFSKDISNTTYDE